MLSDLDSIVLPDGVSLAAGHVTDVVRAGRWPVNSAGAYVLARAGAPIGLVVRELADAFGLDQSVARSDVLRFVWHLNGLALVNVERGGSTLGRARDWLVLAARLVPAGALPVPTGRRRALDTSSCVRAATGCLVAGARRVAAVAALASAAALLVLPVGSLVGAVMALAVGTGAGLALGVHESAHAAALRGVSSALVVRGRRMYVLHAPVGSRRRIVVALAGPLVTAGVGLALICLGTLVAVPLLTIAGCPFAAHAMALTVVGGDGRVACEC